MSMFDQLMEMGFTRVEVEEALAATNHVGVEEAMNFILDNPQPQPDDIVEIVDVPVVESAVRPVEEHLASVNNEVVNLVEEEHVQLVEEGAEEDARTDTTRSPPSPETLAREAQQRQKETALEKHKEPEIEGGHRVWKADLPEPPKPETTLTETVVLTLPPTPYAQTILQISLPNGVMLIEQFRVTETLRTIRAWAHNRCMEEGMLTTGNIELISESPRRVFTESEYSTTLSALGLTPSAYLVVQPSPAPKTK